jgi:hypothetical protein
VPGKTAEGGFESVRSHVIGRRVDEIACQSNGGHGPRDGGSVRICRNDQTRAVGRGFAVALETIGTHAEGQRHDGAGDRRCLDVPVALGQNAGQLAADKRVTLSVIAKAEQGACKLAVAVGDEQHVAFAGLETGGFRPGKRRLVEMATLDVGARDRPDRQRVSGHFRKRGGSIDLAEGRHGISSCSPAPGAENQSLTLD